MKKSHKMAGVNEEEFNTEEFIRGNKLRLKTSARQIF